jgi:hypothetical protein
MYYENLRYLLRHKWFVFIECCRYGIPLRGFMHDMSKFRPCEFLPYAHYFFAREKPTEGYCHEPGTDEAFDRAWLDHIHHNPHHHQYWVLRNDEDGQKILKMPRDCMVEMLCDWKGAGKAQGFAGPDECLKWYTKNRDKMQLHPETRAWIEAELGYLA